MKDKIQEKYVSLCSNYNIQPKSQVMKYLLSKDQSDQDNINLIFPGNIPDNYNNRFTLDELHPLISSLISYGNHVQIIDLSFNNLGSKSGIYLEKLFDYAPNIINVNLKGNSLDDICCFAIVKSLMDKNNVLKELNLNTNCIGNLGLMEIAKLILKKPSLEVLDIGHNYYDWDGLIAINYALKPSIIKSSIKPDNRNNIYNTLENNETNSDRNSPKKIKSIVDETKYTYLPKLKTLNIDDPQYRDNDQDFFTHFGKMLLSNDFLEKISMRFHKLRFDGCKILFHHLESNSNLQVLDISNNQICFQGISFISEYFTDKSYKKEKTKFPNLLSLNLSGNHMHNQGAVILSDGIANNCTLAYLDVSNNGIKNDGLFKLAEGLFENKTIQYFKAFKGNFWGKSCISVFKDLTDIKENFFPDFEIYDDKDSDIQICYKDDVCEDEKQYLIIKILILYILFNLGS